MSPILLGAVLGLVAAVGLLLTIGMSPPMRPIRLQDRLAPYLREQPPPSRLLAGTAAATGRPLAPVRNLLGPVLADATRVVDRLFGGRRSVRRRLRSLGDRLSVEDFRVEQVLWGAVGLAVGIAVTAALSAASGSLNVITLMLFCLGGPIAGILARDWWLSTEVSRREESITAEFPVVAELLALAVAAGEGPIGAIDRVVRMTGGELARDLGDAMARARSGMPFVEALQGVADRTSIDSLARFVDGVIVAIERGTPLADVLRAQAADVREERKRALLESSGKKEIAMMLPVVFLILPVTVLFALYPGFLSIVQLTH